MARDKKKKLKATYASCETCGEFFKHPDYILKFDHIMCKEHMEEFEKAHPELKNRK